MEYIVGVLIAIAFLFFFVPIFDWTITWWMEAFKPPKD